MPLPSHKRQFSLALVIWQEARIRLFNFASIMMQHQPPQPPQRSLVGLPEAVLQSVMGFLPPDALATSLPRRDRDASWTVCRISCRVLDTDRCWSRPW